MRAFSLAFCLGLVAIAGAFLLFLPDLVPYAGTDPYYRQPDFFPLVTLAVLVLVGLALAVKYAAGRALPVDEELSGSIPHFAVLAPLALAFAGYILLTPWIGYLAATLVFGCAALIIGRHLTRGAAAAIILLGLGLHLVFIVYLDVWFPAAPASIERLFG